MNSYLFKRLKVIPITLSLIFFLNFILINLSKESSSSIFHENFTDFLQNTKSTQLEDNFSKNYGLHLPILINTWPFVQEKTLEKLFVKEDQKLIQMAPFVLNQLNSMREKSSDTLKKKALGQIILSGTMQKLTSKHSFGKEEISSKVAEQIILIEDLLKNSDRNFEEFVFFDKPDSFIKKISILFCETRLFKYFKKVLYLDFGTMRYDASKKVAPIVLKKLCFSLLLLIAPIIMTFIFSQLFGLLLALKEDTFLGVILSVFFAALYGIPIYIMAPLLIEKVGIYFGLPIHGMPFFNLSYIILPTFSLLYGALAVYTRINKALFIKLLSQEYLFVAKAKGLTKIRILFVHSFREALLTMGPLILGSFGFFISSLIVVENLFEIDGFGGFFYKAILTHDYNVIIFSTLLISLTSMTFYLFADMVLYKLDPRISRNADQRVFQRV